MNNNNRNDSVNDSEYNENNQPIRSSNRANTLKEYADSSAKSMLLSSLFQLIYIAVLFVLVYLPHIVTMDVLYIPPFVNFTLKNYFKWMNVIYFLMIVTLIQFIFAFIYRKLYNNKVIMIIGLILAIFQLVFVPIGTFFGISEIVQILDHKMIVSGRREELSLDDEIHPTKQIKTNVGLAIFAYSLLNIAVLSLIYYITIYFSYVMLDITYPYLTISIIYQIRNVLWILIGFSILSSIYGILYQKYYQNGLIKALGYFFGISMLFVLPIGTYTAVLLIKDLRYDSIQYEKEEIKT